MIMPELKIFQRNTRKAAVNNPYFISLSTNTTNYYENSFIIRTSRLWNNLPNDVFPKVNSTYAYNLQSFKSNINKLLKNLSQYPQLIPFFPIPN
jgi:hypothetical protein